MAERIVANAGARIRARMSIACSAIALATSAAASGASVTLVCPMPESDVQAGALVCALRSTAAPGSVRGTVATTSESSSSTTTPPPQGGRLLPEALFADESLLARFFGVIAMRELADGRLQIAFAKAPEHRLNVQDADGRSLNPVSDADDRILTFNASKRFFVSDRTHRVEIARLAQSRYHVAQSNPVGLQQVFDRDGSTYFKFSQPANHIEVVDRWGRARGRQVGPFFKYEGTPAEYIVTVDGTTIRVTRTEDVAFYERGVAS